MQNLSISLVQTTQFWEDKTANLNQFGSLLNELENTDLIVLPEMFHTAFTMNSATLAEKMEDSMAMKWLLSTSKEKNSAIYTSFIAEEDGHYFNRGVFVEPTGEFHIYDKRKTFTLAGESDVFSKGNLEQIVHYKGWNINLQICFDLRFPELIRNRLDDAGNAAYDVLLYVANWPEKRSSHWSALLLARAIENQCYVVGVNRVGSDAKDLTYSGDSVVIDALGQTIGFCEPGQTQVVQLSLDYEILMQTRRQLPFLKDGLNRSYLN